MLTPGRYYPGSPIVHDVEFVDAMGNHVDPTTVTAKLTSPSGRQTTFAYGTDANVTKSSIGIYAMEHTPTESGRWHLRWESTGTGTTIATETQFNVQYSKWYDTTVGDYQ